MTNRHDDDPVKKLFGKTAQEIMAEAHTNTTQDHSKFHSPTAFCDNAGPEEREHLQRLLDTLTDDEVPALVDAVGIRFDTPAKDIDRLTLEGVLDETDRETFYREYYRIIDNRPGGQGK